MAIELKTHQLNALYQMRNGCVLKGGVGTGKTITALAYFYEMECGGSVKINGLGLMEPPTEPKDIYVLTTAKKRDDLDWEEEALHFRISTNREFSVGGIQIKVDSWNNIANYLDIKDAFFVFDEQRLVGSGAWVKAFYKIAAQNSWVMLSATPGDSWMDYIPIFVANGYYKNRTEFIREHVVWKSYSKFPKVERYVETGKLHGLRNKLIVDMPYERHTIRKKIEMYVDYNEDQFKRVHKDRWHIYEDRPVKDIGELFRVMRKLVNSDPNRLGAVMQLMEKHPKLIIFYNFNYELEALRTLAQTTGVPISEWNGQKHEDILPGDRWLYLVQYTAGNEGWNCISTDAMVFYSLTYSYKVFEQAQGRIDRLNTPYIHLYYYILRSSSFIDQAIWRALKMKQNFNEKKVKL